VDHEVAAKEMAYGMGGCGDCHLNGQIDWPALGWTADPANARHADAALRILLASM